ncbi:MAG: M50 family metallopeptidase [Chloroflexota bacterium]|nr:M50 family metallopeptidase [Chloroflexota bacterium]
MRRKDWWWLLVYPLYQLLGTLRHEASHALVAWRQGFQVTAFVFWPTRGYWGYVAWDGPLTVATLAAPYVCDLLTFLLFLAVCMRIRFRRRWLWLNVSILGLVSPLVNSFYNYWRGLRCANDVGRLLQRVPPQLVHGYFGLTLGLYCVGIVLVFTLSKTARGDRQDV